MIRQRAAVLATLMLMVLCSTGHAEKRNLHLESKVEHAVASIAKAHGLVLDEADIYRRDESPRVPFATRKDCGGIGYCTGLVIYYEHEPCSPSMDEDGFHTAGPRGNARAWYNVKESGVCYQISGAAKQQAKEIAQSLRGINPHSTGSTPSGRATKDAVQSQIIVITVSDLHRLWRTGMRTRQPYKVATSISGHDNFGDALCDVTRYDGYCDTSGVSVQVSQEALSSQQRRELYDLRGKNGGQLCATVEMSPNGTLLLTEFTAGRCL